MQRPVQFDDQLALRADEIGDIWAYQILAPELVAAEPPVAQLRPEQLLHRRRVVTHLASPPAIRQMRFALLYGVRRWHPPHPSPLPQWGRGRSSLVQRPAPTFGTWCSTSGSRPAHEIVDHAFLAGFVEIDGELVAFDAAHEAVAEFLVEHAVAARILRGGGIGSLHRECLRLDHGRPRARRALRRAIGLRPLPAGALIGAAEMGRLGIVAEAD